MSNFSERTSYIRWDDDDVSFVVDQQLDVYSASSLKQLHSDALPRFWTNRSRLLFLDVEFLVEKQQIPIL